MATDSGPDEKELRRSLYDIIDEHGPEIVTDERRCVALMYDFCPRSYLFNILVGALRTGVLRDMALVGAEGIEEEARVAAERLRDDHAWSSNNAAWAIDVWRSAIGMVGSDAGSEEPQESEWLEEDDSENGINESSSGSSGAGSEVRRVVRKWVVELFGKKLGNMRLVYSQERDVTDEDDDE